VIVTDTLLSRSAYSGSLYSIEFYELVKKRLKEGGIFAQWVASERTLHTAARAFPHVQVVHAHSLGPDEPRLFVAGAEPVAVEPALLRQRYLSGYPERLRPRSARALEGFLDTAFADPVRADPAADATKINRDLFARDEYGNW
jgi:spermidine synthase